MPIVQLSLSQPTHGWLPVRIELGKTITEFVASDVPNNPVEELCDAITSTASGNEGTVWWNLEPDGYFLELSNAQEQVRLRLLYAKNSAENGTVEAASAIGSKSEVLMPLWRALRQFESLHIQEPHWPPTRLVGLGELRDALQTAGYNSFNPTTGVG